MKLYSGIPSFDLGVCEQLMESKTGYDIHMRQSSKDDRKRSLLNPFAPSRKNSISKGLAGTAYMNRLPSPKGSLSPSKTPPIPEVTTPTTPVTYTDTLRLT